MLLERYTLPAQCFPGLQQHDLEQRSIYDVRGKEYGVTIACARLSFEPVVASLFEAELLQIAVGAPPMLETRVSCDQQDIPVEVGKDRYRGDRFRFITEPAPLGI